RRVRDRLEVVGDLVDDDGLHPDLDPLRGDAFEVELRLVDVEREVPDLLEPRQVERALPDHDLEAEPGLVTLGAAMSPRSGDDEPLVRLGDLEEEHASPFPASVTADDERAGRLALQHENLASLGDRVFALHRVREEALPATANRNHHLAHPPRRDRTRAVA